VTFECRRLRFRLCARDPLHWPPGKSGNTLRGAFGTALDSVSRARLFAPRARGGPSGLADPPRPFVFRAAHLDGLRLEAGEAFHFDLHLFDLSAETAALFTAACHDVCRAGIGPRRGRALLEAVETLPASAIRLDVPEPAGAVRVVFSTPTELKAGEALAVRPEFPILFARLRDRISTLLALYGAGPLDLDYRGAGERAGRIRMTRCELECVRLERRSSRTGRSHPLGGFRGIAEYAGDLAEFMPYLRAGEWTGVGRQTVWGKGAIQVAALPT
jgi:hypothetical protein